MLIFLIQEDLRGCNVTLINQRQTEIIRTFNDAIVIVSASGVSLFGKNFTKTFGQQDRAYTSFNI